MNYDEELRWVRRRDNAHRTKSRATAGYERDLLRSDSDDELLGPTESRAADIDEIVQAHSPVSPVTSAASPPPTAGQQILGAALDGILEALQPFIDRGVDVTVDAAFAGLGRLWRWATAKRGEAARAKADENGPRAVVEAIERTDLPEDAEVEPADAAVSKRRVSADQYRAILLAALLADQYAARLRQMLEKVQVEDDVLPPELDTALRAAIEGPTPTTDDARLAQVVNLLASGETSEGDFMLVRAKGSDQLPREVRRRT
ncbi:hypothetical protein [Microbacterium sp.]|uniref:hypothetical protein n=1 Tax=Microbacterium sp. TaxID=51671 RepID=UPI00289ABCAC|nr:hypothetical protein [Microbacterium sp.]